MRLYEMLAVEVDCRVIVKMVGEAQPQLRARCVSTAIEVYWNKLL